MTTTAEHPGRRIVTGSRSAVLRSSLINVVAGQVVLSTGSNREPAGGELLAPFYESTSLNGAGARPLWVPAFFA